MKICCTRCGGTGEIDFTGEMADTLELLKKQKAEITGADLSRIAQCEATTMNNRLAYLERVGLAKSRRYGRKRLYVVAKNGQ